MSEKFNKEKYLKEQSDKMKNGTGNLSVPKNKNDKSPAFNMLIKSEGEIYDIAVWKGKFEGGYYFYLPDNVIIINKNKLIKRKEIERELEMMPSDDVPF